MLRFMLISESVSGRKLLQSEAIGLHIRRGHVAAVDLRKMDSSHDPPIA